MTSWLDEVQAGVHAIVHNLLPVDAVFLFQIRVEPSLDVLDDGFPARKESVLAREARSNW